MFVFNLFVFILCVFCGHCMREDAKYWKKLTSDDLDKSLKLEYSSKRAKNVILFIGDGMGPNTVAAARIYHKTETGKLSFEEFPHFGAIKTYSADYLVPDSASTATAMYSGVKVNSRTAGVTPNVVEDDCLSSLNKSNHLETVLKWSQDAGKSTGFVTNTRITHATPMALYAHTPQRDWECNAAIPEKYRGKCIDIARQLIEFEPGKNLQVIMGGGLQTLQTTYEGKYDSWSCLRTDNRSLIDDWVADKKRSKLSYAVLRNNKDLNELNVEKTDYVLGVFANGHLPFDHERNRSPAGEPSLVNMTEAAIKILSKNSNGFFLMVEGGLIDQAHHRGKARKALNEVAVFSEAVQRAIEVLKHSIDDTLIIVTADHAHGLSYSGYPDRGSSILGIAGQSSEENRTYTALNYAVGDKHNFQFDIIDGRVVRKEPNNTEDFEYSQQTGILHKEGVHGGADVYIYAKGPMSHLFHSSHEQPFIARVISYALRIGDETDKSSANLHELHILTITISSFYFIFKQFL